MSETKFTVDYFIAKFEAIPEEKWTTGICMDSEGRKCAFGHCGCASVSEAESVLEAAKLSEILEPFGKVYRINDSLKSFGHLGSNPRARILAALNEIKSKEAK